VFVLDSSGSEGSVNFRKQLNFVTSLVNAYDIDQTDGVRLGLLTFSTTTHVQFDLNTYSNKPNVLHAIANTPYLSGGTNTAAALRTALTHSFIPNAGDRPHVPDIMFVITDGKSTSRTQTYRAADAIHLANIKTYAIGVGLSVNHPELSHIASDSQHVFSVSSFDKLHMLQNELVSISCNSKYFFVIYISCIYYDYYPTTTSHIC
jgi:hypothetical protein